MPSQTYENHPIWYPYTQEKTSPPPCLIERAKGSYLYTKDGRKIFDGISSWWVNIHGHSNSYLLNKIFERGKQMEQILFEGFTHSGALELAEKILALLPDPFQKVFFSDNGSTSVEVAIKMALQSFTNQGIKRNQIIAFKGGYHGDTFGARAVTDAIDEPCGLSSSLTQVDFITPPLKNDPDAMAQSLREMEVLIESHRKNPKIGAFIFEPMIQGVAGMRVLDSDTVSHLIRLAQAEKIPCIADEVMTGFGRTGKNFAIEHLSAVPDIICLAKGLTGGILPLSLTVCQNPIFEQFLSKDKSKALLHGHSFTGNALSCAAALASLELLGQESTQKQIQMISNAHNNFLNHFMEGPYSSKLKDARSLGTIMALEFKSPEKSGYFNSFANKISEFFLSRDILLRPLGNTLYLIPPYCSQEEDLKKAYTAITEFSQEIED